MSATVAAQALAVAAIAGLLVSWVGATRSVDALTAQHFVAAAGTVPVVLLAAAVVTQEGLGSAAVLAIVSVAAVLLTGPASTTAFGRALAGSEGPQQPEDSPAGEQSP